MAEGMNTGPAGAVVMSNDDVRQQLAAQASSIGRFQAPEIWFTQTVSLTAPNQITIPRQMPLNRPAESITLQLLLRATVANNNMTAVVPEAPATLIRQIQLNGTHRKWANLTPLRMSGETAYFWPSLFQRSGGTTIINGALAADPGIPFVSPFTGLVGAHDMIIEWNIPLGPLMGIGQATKRELASFLYNAEDWGDSLQLQLNLGDASALGTPNAPGDVTITAFGSGAGTPTLNIFVNYSILGPFAGAIESGVIIRNEQLFNQFVTAGVRQRISQLQKQITLNTLLKSGTILAGTTSGVSVFGTLSDAILDQTMPVVDNKPIKFNQNNNMEKAYVSRMFAVPIPEGYFNLTWVDGQNPMLSYRADGLAGGSLFELQSDILTTQAQTLAMVQEMSYGGPFPALRPL